VVAAALLLAQPAAAGTWAQQGVALPLNATSVLTGVSCTSPDTCMAVGSFHDSGGTHLLAESRSGSAWTTVSIADPGGAQLNAISCTSPTACTAVGSSGTGTLAERWDGTQWTIQSTPPVSGTTSSVLKSVVCVSATACTAVGSSSSAPNTDATLAESWDGSSWSIQPTPNVSGAAFSVLLGVSCTSPAMCIAVGNSGTGTSSQTLAEGWNGSAWTTQATPNLPNGAVSRLEGVSCKTRTACVAVGSGLSESWDGTSWTLQLLAKPRHGDEPDLARVSCPALKSCTAADTFEQDAILTLLVEHWNGTTWKVQQTPIAS